MPFIVKYTRVRQLFALPCFRVRKRNAGFAGLIEQNRESRKNAQGLQSCKQRKVFHNRPVLNAFLSLIVACMILPSPGGEVEILCTTDLHGRAEAFAALAPILRKNPNAIRIDCGDTLQGTLLSRLSRGQIMISLLNELKYDIWVPGNHDFDFGADSLVAAAGNFHGATLGAEFSRENFRPGSWTLLSRNGYKIAVVGMTDPKMPSRLLPDSGWNFESNRDALRRILPEILAKKPNLILLAWHSGPYTPPGTMFRFLSEFPEVDLVLAGHSHEEVPGRKIAGAWFVQAGRYGACFARITADFDDRTGKLFRLRSELVRPDQKQRPDKGAMRVLEPFLHAYRPVAEEVLATTKPPLKLPEKGDNTLPICTLGSEAIRVATGADAALFSVSAFPEIELPEKVTNAGIFKLLPYENELCTVQLRGEEFVRLVKETGEASRRGRSVFRFSGIEVEYHTKGAWRVPKIPQTLILAVSSYTLTVSPLLKQKLASGAFRRSGLWERDAVADYLRRLPERGRPRK